MSTVTSVEPQLTRRAARLAAGAHQPAASPTVHFTAIDGARGIAIISVLLYHSGWSTRGLFGVDAFFVISGFLISFLLLKELRSTGRIRIARFYARRARRLLPPLVITLGLVLLMVWRFGSLSELHSAATTAVFSLAQIANWQQLGSDTAYWEQSGQIVPLGQMWSLSATEQFYVAWPILLIAAWVLGRRQTGAVAALLFVGLAAASLVAPVLFDGSNTDRLYLGTDSRAVSFIAGAAFAALVTWVLQKAPSWAGATPSRRAKLCISGVSMLSLAAVVAVSVATASYHEGWLYQGGLTAVSVLVAIFTATLCFAANALNPVLSWKPLTHIGVLSYSLFLVHLPIFWFLQYALGVDTPPLFLFALGGTLSYIAALVLHYVVAEPLRLRSWSRRGALIAIVLGFGLVLAAAWYLPAQRAAASSDSATQAQSDPNQAFAVDGNSELPSGPTNEPLTVAVIGDSVAANMYESLAEYSSGSVVALDLTTGGCGIFDADSARSGEGYVMDTPTQCWPWKDKLRQANAEHSPDVYILHNLWDANDQLIDGEWVGPGSAAWQARYESQLELLVAIGAETGKQPLILLSNDRARDPAGPLSRERLDAVNAVAATIAAKYPNVQILDLEGTTCVDGNCLTADAQGRDIYRDGAHFSETGLELMAPWLEEQIAVGLGAAG